MGPLTSSWFFALSGLAASFVSIAATRSPKNWIISVMDRFITSAMVFSQNLTWLGNGWRRLPSQSVQTSGEYPPTVPVPNGSLPIPSQNPHAPSLLLKEKWRGVSCGKLSPQDGHTACSLKKCCSGRALSRCCSWIATNPSPCESASSTASIKRLSSSATNSSLSITSNTSCRMPLWRRGASSSRCILPLIWTRANPSFCNRWKACGKSSLPFSPGVASISMPTFKPDIR